MYYKRSNKSETTKVPVGISFCPLLTIAFIVLKLIGAINWGWLWVLAPLWMPIALAVMVAIIVVLVKSKSGD